MADSKNRTGKKVKKKRLEGLTTEEKRKTAAQGSRRTVRCFEGQSISFPPRQKTANHLRLRLHAWPVHLSPNRGCSFHPARTITDCVFGQIRPWAGKRSAICRFCLETSRANYQSCSVRFSNKAGGTKNLIYFF